MKQYTVRLEDSEVEQLEELIKEKGLAGSQKGFEWVVKYYLQIERHLKSAEGTSDYWQEQYDFAVKENQRLREAADEKIRLLRDIIEEGLGKRVM